MMTIEELRERLKAHIEESQESQNAFAKRLGIQQGSIFRFIKGETTLALEPALKVLGDMGYRLLSRKELLENSKEGSLPSEQRSLSKIKSLEEKLGLQEELGEAQKKIIELQNQLLDVQKKQPQEFKKSADEDSSKSTSSTYF